MEVFVFFGPCKNQENIALDPFQSLSFGPAKGNLHYLPRPFGGGGDFRLFGTLRPDPKIFRKLGA